MPPLIADENAHCARLVKQDDINGDLVDKPIIGISQAPNMTLTACLEGLTTPDAGNLGAVLIDFISLALTNVQSMKLGTLTSDEAAAINIFTMETPLHRAINTALQSTDKDKLTPYLPYLKLLLSALFVAYYIFP
jgi:hypothetical protein